MTESPREVRVLQGELRARCKRCKRWGRKSPTPSRSEFSLHGKTSSGDTAWRLECRDCQNHAYRVRLRKKRPPARLACNTVDVTDDYGVIQRVRRCNLCLSWLPATLEVFDGRGKKGGLQVWCKECRRAKQRADYQRNPKPKRKRNRRYYHEVRADILSIDRALKAEQEGREYRPIREVKQVEQWLTIEPFSEWLKQTIPRFDELNKYGTLDGGITRLAEAVGCSERHVRRLRDCEHSTVRLSDVLRYLEFAGGIVEDIWPDYEEAIEEGFRRRFENQHVPNRAAA